MAISPLYQTCFGRLAGKPIIDHNLGCWLLTTSGLVRNKGAVTACLVEGCSACRLDIDSIAIRAAWESWYLKCPCVRQPPYGSLNRGRMHMGDVGMRVGDYAIRDTTFSPLEAACAPRGLWSRRPLRHATPTHPPNAVRRSGGPLEDPHVSSRKARSLLGSRPN